MKKTILALALLFISAGVMAQSKVISKYFDKYEDNEDFTKVSLNARMFSLLAELETGSKEEQEFVDAVSKIEGLKVLMGEQVANSASLYKEAIKDVDRAGYDELMTVKDAEENMKFSIKEKGGIIEELIMVVGGNKKFILLSLYGDIDLKKISSIAKSMDVGGLKNLSRINSKDDNNDN